MGTKIPALQIAANQFVGVASITTLGLTTLDPAYIANATERTGMQRFEARGFWFP